MDRLIPNPRNPHRLRPSLPVRREQQETYLREDSLENSFVILACTIGSRTQLTSLKDEARIVADIVQQHETGWEYKRAIRSRFPRWHDDEPTSCGAGDGVGARNRIVEKNPTKRNGKKDL